jgi:hypothetical protein
MKIIPTAARFVELFDTVRAKTGNEFFLNADAP